jgi:predicted MFS family arabinose efflux permease
VAALALTAASIGGFGLLATFPLGPAAVAASAAAIMVYGLGTWAVTPPQQQRLLAHGGGRVLLSLNASALYAGVALGGIIGGVTLSLSRSIAAVCWTAAVIEVTALAVVRRAAGADLASR